MPGRFPSVQKVYGLLRLEKVLKDHFIGENIENEGSEEKKEKSKQLDRIIFQFSSIGSLGPNENSWLCSQLKNSMSESKNEKHAFKTSLPICIYPTFSNVANSYEGLAAGCSLPYFEKTASKQKYLENFL